MEVNERLSKAISKARSQAGKSSDKGKIFNKDIIHPAVLFSMSYFISILCIML